MNFILYIHDHGEKPVWPFAPGVTDQVAKEVNDLISGYTMGRASVDVVPDIYKDYRLIADFAREQAFSGVDADLLDDAHERIRDALGWADDDEEDA